MEMNPAAKIYVGEVAATYNEIRVHKPKNIEDGRILEVFLDACESGSTIVDVPAGTGRAVTPILSRKLSYIGVDISPDMLEICRQEIADRPNASLMRSDARRIPLPAHSIDYLVSIKLIKWFPTDQMVLEALTEFRRVCRGRALVSVKIKTSPTPWFKRFAKRSSRRPDGRAMEEECFEVLCGRSGWTVVERHQNRVKSCTRFYVLE